MLVVYQINYRLMAVDTAFALLNEPVFLSTLVTSEPVTISIMR